MAEIVQIDADRPDPKIIRRACMLLEAGELVGVPTETVYGIACDPAHLEKLYAAKERDRGKPVARLAASLEQVEALGANFGKDGRALAEKYWPGPLTLVLDVSGGRTGFRVPDHEVPLALARAFGKPIALTSANKSGGTDALTVQEAFQCFQTLENPVALYLDPFQGSEKTSPSALPTFQCLEKRQGWRLSLPSTVVQCLENETKILREGAISALELKQYIH